MNRNVNRSYDEEICYQFINPVHSFLMESVHEQHNFIFPVWIPARGTKARRAEDEVNRTSEGSLF